MRNRNSKTNIYLYTYISTYVYDYRKPQNEKNQIMKSNVWLRLVWYDYQLQWDEADYGGIGVLRLPPDKVWKPDIVLFNK